MFDLACANCSHDLSDDCHINMPAVASEIGLSKGVDQAENARVPTRFESWGRKKGKLDELKERDWSE